MDDHTSVENVDVVDAIVMDGVLNKLDTVDGVVESTVKQKITSPYKKLDEIVSHCTLLLNDISMKSHIQSRSLPEYIQTDVLISSLIVVEFEGILNGLISLANWLIRLDGTLLVIDDYSSITPLDTFSRGKACFSCATLMSPNYLDTLKRRVERYLLLGIHQSMSGISNKSNWLVSNRLLISAKPHKELTDDFTVIYNLSEKKNKHMSNKIVNVRLDMGRDFDSDVMRLVENVYTDYLGGSKVMIYCKDGIKRSCIVSCLLVKMISMKDWKINMSVDECIKYVSHCVNDRDNYTVKGKTKDILNSSSRKTVDRIFIKMFSG